MSVPTRPVFLSMNDLRTVALTSVVMKVCERVVLCKLEKVVKGYIDPLQFAYTKNKSTDDAEVIIIIMRFYTVQKISTRI